MLAPAIHPGSRAAGVCLALVLAGGTLLRLFFLLQPILWLVSFFPADDYFYYLQTAANLAAGHGSSFDGGLTRHNGFQPLFLMLLLLGFATGLSKAAMVYAGLAVQSTAMLVAAWLASRIVRRANGPWMAVAAAAALSLNLVFVRVSLWGFETALLLAMMLAAIDASERNAGGWTVGLWLGLSGLARIDGMLLALPLGIQLARRRGPAAVAQAALIAATMWAPWLLWNRLAFGSLLPGSGAIKRLSSSGWDGLPLGLGTLLEHVTIAMGGEAWRHVLPGGLLVAAGAVLLALAARRMRSLAWLLLYVAGCTAAYSTLTDAHLAPQLGRYLLPAATLLVVAVLAAAPKPHWLWCSGILLSAVVTGQQFVRWSTRTGDLDTYVGLCQRAAPTALADVLRADDRVGSFDAGALGYFSSVPVVNLDGLVNADIVDMLQSPQAAQRSWTDLYRDYLRRMKITVLVGGTAYSWVNVFPGVQDWEPLCDPLHSSDGGEILFVRLPPEWR